MAFYVFLAFRKLAFNLDDKNTTQAGLMDLESIGDVQYDQTSLFNFFVIRKQVPVDKALYLGPELRQYVDLSYR